MDAKEYLRQAYRLDQAISSKIEQISSLRELATKATAALGTEPVSGSRNPHRLEDAIGKIVDLENEIDRDVDCLIETKRKIMGIIGELGNAEHRILLEQRYLCYNSWAEIAEKMGFGLRWVHILHGRALAEADKIFSKKAKDCT
ncbi:MAG: hypothetical protein IJ631_04160 [Schwartzia sp.]|nr:hypothetical protein [Schwartzia sp. (in: firmicutes)]